jgi:L,D-transpeptidase catalytic domain
MDGCSSQRKLRCVLNLKTAKALSLRVPITLLGRAISSGCIRMTNEDVIDLYNRVRLGTRVVVHRLPSARRTPRRITSAPTAHRNSGELGFQLAMVPATGRVRPSRTRSIGRDRSLERLSADSQKTVSQFEFG